MPPVSGKVRVLNFIRKGEKPNAEVAKIYEVGSGDWWVREDLKWQAAWTMASDLDFSPPEVPEPTFLENLLRYGLFLGAIFQLICVLAIIVPIPKSPEAEAEPAEPRNVEVSRRPKAVVPSASKRPKKETKKKR